MNSAERTLPVWQRLGQPSPDTLRDARLQAHWAVQIVAAVGYTLVAPQSDWSHTSLAWLDEHDALASQWAPGPPRFRVALRLADLTLLLLDHESLIRDTFDLNGATLDAGYTWLAAAVADHRGMSTPPPITRPDLDVPSHPTATEQAFSCTPAAAFSELARWFANTHRTLYRLRMEHPEASPVRTWPHHFDMAVLFTFDPDRDPEEARSIGVGMTPGDASYAEPYWYINLWPYPQHRNLPSLAGEGTWHTEGWLGAVLTGPQTTGAGDAAAQAARVEVFIRSGMAACRTLLGLST